MLHPTDEHVGKRVRQARIAKSLSQGALGQALGISFQQVQKYESGSNRIGSSRLWDISQILDTPIEFFFEGLAPRGSSNTMEGAAEEEPMTRRTIQLAKAINNLHDEEAKMHFLRLIEAYSKVV